MKWTKFLIFLILGLTAVDTIVCAQGTIDAANIQSPQFAGNAASFDATTGILSGAPADTGRFKNLYLTTGAATLAQIDSNGHVHRASCSNYYCWPDSTGQTGKYLVYNGEGLGWATVGGASAGNQQIVYGTGTGITSNSALTFNSGTNTFSLYNNAGSAGVSATFSQYTCWNNYNFTGIFQAVGANAVSLRVLNNALVLEDGIQFGAFGDTLTLTGSTKPYHLPMNNGTVGQVLTTDGNRTAFWQQNNIARDTLVTTAYTALNYDNIVLVNQSAAITITLPASPPTGSYFTVKDYSGSAASNNITVSGNGSNIDGASTAVISTAYAYRTYYFTGTKYTVIY